MYEETKWWAVVVIVIVLTFGGVIGYNTYHSWQTDQIAIKQGLVQKVDQAHVVWTKP